MGQLTDSRSRFYTAPPDCSPLQPVFLIFFIRKVLLKLNGKWVGTAIISVLTFLLLFSSQARAIDVATPVKYTALLMAVEFAGLYAFDMAEDAVRFSNFEEMLRHPKPEEDDDDNYVNFLLHPLMGSETYLRAREGDFGVVGSIAFSMAASITWEYLVESWTEHPSTQDLVFTTGIGWLLGELRYTIKQSNIAAGRTNFWVDPIWVTLEYLELGITQTEGKVTPSLSLKIPL